MVLPCDLAGAFITMPSSLQNQSLRSRNHFSCTYDIQGLAFTVHCWHYSPLGHTMTTTLLWTGIMSGHFWRFCRGARHEGTSCMLHSTHQSFQLHHTTQLHQFPFSTTSISIAITLNSKHNYINFHCQLHLFPLPLHQCPISTTSISIAHINSMPASIPLITKHI